jgi:hypothetical protein
MLRRSSVQVSLAKQTAILQLARRCKNGPCITQGLLELQYACSYEVVLKVDDCEMRITWRTPLQNNYVYSVAGISQVYAGTLPII